MSGRYAQCDDTCTVDCGHCKGAGPPTGGQSQQIGPSLAEAGHDVPRMPMGTTCAVHIHREWVPIEQHHVWPKGMGGPDTPANKIAVCANGHYSIHEVIRRLIANNGTVPDAEHFSAKVKKYAVQGWTEAGKPTHGGGGE